MPSVYSCNEMGMGWEVRWEYGGKRFPKHIFAPSFFPPSRQLPLYCLLQFGLGSIGENPIETWWIYLYLLRGWISPSMSIEADMLDELEMAPRLYG